MIDANKLTEEKEKNILLYFSSPYCMPCKMVKPFIEEQEKIKNLEIYSVNILERQDLVEKYKVFHSPVLLKIVNGIETERYENPQTIKNFLQTC